MNVLRRWRWFGVVAAAVLGLTPLLSVPRLTLAAPASAPSANEDEEEEQSDETDDKAAANPQQPGMIVNGEEQGQTPQRGFSVKKEDAKLIDALEDFRRHSQKKAWELAFKSLASVTEKDPKGMVPAGDGLMVPTRQRIWKALATLPADGREAYRLFNDATAKQRFERATAAGDDIAALREIFQLYFITSVGDEAADRLGDACFETGDFLAADAAWKAIFDHYPDTKLSKTRLRLKRCAALARANRWDAFDEVAAGVGAEGASESTRLAGRNVTPAEFLASLREGAGERAQAAADMQADASKSSGPIQLPRENRPLWQVRFMDETLAEKFDQALRNMGWGNQETPVSTSVPPSVTDGKRVYLNWLGIAFAVDSKTGKLLWRTRKFSELSNQAQQFVYGGVNISRYSIALDGDHVLITGMPLDQLNQGMGGSYRMVCHNGETGAIVWSTKTGDGAPYSIAGAPLPVGETIYVTANRTNQQELHLLALSRDKGKLQWSVPLGTPQASVDYRGMQQGPSPLLVNHGSSIYVVTNNGAVLAVNVADRKVEWAFTCEPPPILSGYVMFFNPSMTRRSVKTPGAAFVRGSTLYFKESGGYAIYALDLAGPSLKWKRPADSSETIVGIGGDGKGGPGGGSVYLVGESVSAIDLNTRAMRWSASVPVETGMLRPILGGDRLYVFSSRGVFQIDTASGDSAGQPFRGADLESLGGALWDCGDKLVAVSNLAVTAYPLPQAAARQSAAR